MRNPKLVSDLKSDIYRKSYDDVPISNRWTIKLYPLSTWFRGMAHLLL